MFGITFCWVYVQTLVRGAYLHKGEMNSNNDGVQVLARDGRPWRNNWVWLRLGFPIIDAFYGISAYAAHFIWSLERNQLAPSGPQQGLH
jgi:hypothetical protein